MTYFPHSTEDIIRRLRWVMLLVMLIDTACTLAGQPPAYWHDPSKANEIEPVVRFLLVRGALPFGVAALLYLCGVFYIVSVAPARIALTILFAFLLAHFWGATSWLLYHFHYGVRSQNVFEIAIAALITLALGRERAKTEWKWAGKSSPHSWPASREGLKRFVEVRQSLLLHPTLK